MSPWIHNCILCGSTISNHRNSLTPQWNDLFRTLYSVDGRVSISGIGRAWDRQEEWLAAPLDPDQSWDTSPYTCVPMPLATLGPCPDETPYYGFAVHPACWSILEEACLPGRVPLKRLFDICRSLPTPWGMDMGHISWDHDFWGTICRRKTPHPWVEVFFFPSEGQYLPFEEDDPCRLVPEMQRLPEVAAASAPGAPEEMAMGPRGDYGVFTSVPNEVVGHMAQHLSTEDYFSARLALRPFYHVFYTRQFWASRFAPGGELAWIFEAREWPRSSDWPALYRLAKEVPSEVRNRERVWNIARNVRGITLGLTWMELPPVVEQNGHGRQDGTTLLEVAAQIVPDSEQEQQWGCRRFHQRHMAVDTDGLTHIAFSLTQTGTMTHITGIRLISTGGSRQDGHVGLGYKAEREYVVALDAQLTGLRLAVGPRGIRAIQCVVGTHRALPWVGCPNEAPITDRLVRSEPITELGAGFDGYKMVSLSARFRGQHSGSDLLTSALWYPHIPEADFHLRLNESTFLGRECALSEYEPLSWMLFGGPRGEYLRYLTGIHANKHVASIIFFFNSDQVPPECRRAGSEDVTDADEVASFAIDGPGGERIIALTTYTYTTEFVLFGRVIDKHQPKSFEMTTNFGRKFLFRDMPLRRWENHRVLDTVTTTTSAGPGEVIHGLYWAWDYGRTSALGAISGKVEDGCERDGD